MTLANLWQVRRGGAGPDDFLVPLTVDVRVDGESGELEEEQRLLLMWLPLPIGVRERDGVVGFDPPAVFWASGRAERDRPEVGDRFLGFEDTVAYDRQTGFEPLCWRRCCGARCCGTVADTTGSRTCCWAS